MRTLNFGNDYKEETKESGLPQRTHKKRNRKRKPKLIYTKGESGMMPGKVTNEFQNRIPV